MHTKNFLVKIYAYHYKLEFNINCFEGPTDIENAIVDKLGKGDIKWDKSDFYSQRKTWLTYEEIVNDSRPLQTKNVLGVELATRV